MAYDFVISITNDVINIATKVRTYCHDKIISSIFYCAEIFLTIIGSLVIFLFFRKKEQIPPKPPYVPKRARERNKVTKCKKIIFTCLDFLCAKLVQKLDSWAKPLSRSDFARTRRQLSRINTPRIKTKRISKRRAILAMSVLAMNSQVNAVQRYSTFDTDSKIIGIDNRCTGCISAFLDDFVGPIVRTNKTIKGIGGDTEYEVFRGTLRWSWCDDDGTEHTFDIPDSYYVKGCGVRLLSPQHWSKVAARNQGKKSLPAGTTTTHQGVKMFWGKQREFELNLPLTASTKVANIPMNTGYKQYSEFCKKGHWTTTKEDRYPIYAKDTQLCCLECNIDDEVKPPAPLPKWDSPQQTSHTCDFDLNAGERVGISNSTKGRLHAAEDTQLSIDEKRSLELLRYHQQMGHASFRKLQLLAMTGGLPKYLSNCRIPVCSSCMYAKMSRRPWRTKHSSKQLEVLKPTTPGEVVAVDHLISPTAGLIAQMTGILTKKRYTCATIFVDMYTRYGYVYLQQSTSAEETVKAKHAFELHAKSMGVNIQGYHADNGTFRANAWINDCNRRNQRMTFAGVNAHHQNGMAERRIKELQELARSMLMHAHRRWENCITANLWPYALRMANEAFNNLPSLVDSKRRSPLQMFAKSNVVVNPKHFQPFGCPVYVLDNDLQLKKPFHKWKERSRVGIYIGQSPIHSRNVALVLDRETGLVSPQFHVKYDPTFISVKEDNLPCKWQIACGFKKDPMEELEPMPVKKKKVSIQLPADIPPSEGGLKGIPNSEGVMGGNEKSMKPSQQLQPKSSHGDLSSNKMKTSTEKRQDTTSILKTPQRSDTPAGNGISGSELSGQVPNTPASQMEVMLSEMHEATSSNSVKGEIMCLETMFPQNDEIAQSDDPLLVYKASADPDTMYMHEAMREPDRNEFKKAMVKEVKDQMENGNFTIVKKSEVPKGKAILPAVWQMKRKRDIRTRKVKKWKARLNIDGSRMVKGVHYDQTYSPVASWKSIRLLLIMIAKNRWHSRQIDYVLAFPQAPVEKEIYMKIPKGFDLDTTGFPKGTNTNDYVLRLNRNVYGQKQASRVWFQYLSTKLINELGFTQSKIDECVFYRGKTMYVLYTDDSLIAGPDKNEIEQVIKDLKKAKLDITDEGDIRDFLGINIELRKDGSVKLSQPHLIDQILEDINMTQANTKVKKTPALASKLLTRNAKGEKFDNSFHYRSIIGKLNYLEKGTRSDISYITHQLARFTENPRANHAQAVRWLGRYLHGTRDKGLILRPDKSKSIDVYVDADFSGNWEKEGAASDRDTARSRHGYIIMYNGCPMIWKSQLQGEIALSSTESEYIGISYALREVIPIMELLKEMKRKGFEVGSTVPKLHCKVFEDNSGALEMAREHKYRPRTKHLNVKLHHFRDYVDRGEITIHKIDTLDQLADYLTKPVNEEILTKLRKLVMGW